VLQRKYHVERADALFTREKCGLAGVWSQHGHQIIESTNFLCLLNAWNRLESTHIEPTLTSHVPAWRVKYRNLDWAGPRLEATPKAEPNQNICLQIFLLEFLESVLAGGLHLNP
jgi:hypothetical protein